MQKLFVCCWLGVETATVSKSPTNQSLMHDAALDAHMAGQQLNAWPVQQAFWGIAGEWKFQTDKGGKRQAGSSMVTSWNKA